MHLGLQKGRTFAQGLLSAHHCAGVGIAEVTGVPALAEELGRGEEAHGRRGLWPAD